MAMEMGDRPQPKSFVQVDLNNAYARLGVSPLATDKEIKQLYNEKDAKLRGQLRDKANQQFSSIEQQITELQEIEALIGSPKARARYDQEHPYNESLTVQPLPGDRFDDPIHRANLATEWLVEQLGRTALLHTPESAAIWGGNAVASLNRNSENGSDDRRLPDAPPAFEERFDIEQLNP